MQRLDNGMFVSRCKPPIHPPLLNVAKAEAALNVAGKNIMGYCAICRTDTAVPSDVQCITERGCCTHCEPYLDGKVPDVMVYTRPGILDVIEQVDAGEDLTPIEQGALTLAYRQMHEAFYGSI